MEHTILVINPGSTSTKVSLFNENGLIATQTIRHTKEEIGQFKRIGDQAEFRKKLIIQFMREHHLTVDALTAVVGRGGLLKPIPGGTYLVDEEMLVDLKEEKYNTHASNLGAILSDDIARMAGIKAYIVDPVVVDEMEPIAKISGLKGINRRSVSHALNQKAVARKSLEKEGRLYTESQVIVAHLGGGTSIGAHDNGKMIDVVNGLDGEGPYSPERTGTLPLYDFAKKILNENLTIEQIKKELAGQGGIHSYLNETDLRRVTQRIEEGDLEAKYYLDGMCYQVGKSIAEMAAVLKGKVNMIILTGGVTYSDYVVNQIKDYVDWIAPVEVVLGEMEMEALYSGVMRVLSGEEEAIIYSEMNEERSEGKKWQ